MRHISEIVPGDQREKRLGLACLLCILIVAAPLISAQKARGEGQVVTGTALLSNSLQYGSTAYAVIYSHPSAAEVGTNLTLTITLRVVSFTGLVDYIYNYGITARVFAGTHVLNGSVSAGTNPVFLYPGAVWGPNNITIPLTEANTGVAKGSSVNATVSLTLADLVYFGGQLGITMNEPPMQGDAGSLLIGNSVSSSTSQTGGVNSQGPGGALLVQTLFLYALLATGAILMLVAAFLPRIAPRPS